MLPAHGQPFSREALQELQETLAYHGRLLWIEPESGSIKTKEVTLQLSSQRRSEVEYQDT